MPSPTFIVIGAGKAGTTWLWQVLRQHPRLYLPEVKELHYFDRESFEDYRFPNPNYGRPAEWYLSFFADAPADAVVGEVTPNYLNSESAPEDIHAFNPSMKLIVLIRDPVERSHSSYLFRIQTGVGKPVTFEEAIKQHPFIIERSLYGRYLTRYLELFPPAQILVRRFDEIRDDPTALLSAVHSFLGVSPEVPPHGWPDRLNATQQPRNPALTRSLMRGRMFLKRHGFERAMAAAYRTGAAQRLARISKRTEPFRARPQVDPATDAQLREYFLADIELTEQITGLDLSAWKGNAAASQPRVGDKEIPRSAGEG